MTIGWTAKILKRSRRLIFSFSLEGSIWEGVGGVGQSGASGRRGMQDPFTWEPGLRLSSTVRSTFSLGLESGVHSFEATGWRPFW